MRAWLLLLPALGLSGCGVASPEKADPCPQGLCTPSGGTSGTGATTGGGGCVEAWTCTAWVKGADDLYTRTCNDANACGTDAARPPEGPVALPELDVDYYKCRVEPILDRGCAMLGCHGTETGRAFKIYARGRLRNNEVVAQVPSCPLGPQQVNLNDEGTGTVMCIGWSGHTATEWQQNYDNARSFMIGLTDPEESELLTQAVYGGKAHTGVHLFAKSDPDYQTIKAWLGGAKLGSVCDPAPN